MTIPCPYIYVHVCGCNDKANTYLCPAHKDVWIIFSYWPALSIIYHFFCLFIIIVLSNIAHFLQVMLVPSLNIVLHILKHVHLVKRPQIQKDIDIRKGQCSTENNPPQQRFRSVQHLSLNWMIPGIYVLCLNILRIWGLTAFLQRGVVLFSVLWIHHWDNKGQIFKCSQLFKLQIIFLGSIRYYFPVTSSQLKNSTWVNLMDCYSHCCIPRAPGCFSTD